MSNDIWGWLGFAMTVVSFLATIKDFLAGPRRRKRRVERFRSLKVWGVEWTACDREDDIQS